MNELTDNILLVKLIQQGDEKAFKQLFDLYFVSLCRFANLYTKHTQEAEEIVMDLFIHIWEHRTALNIHLSVKAYLFQAVRNKILNHLRNSPDWIPIDELPDEPAVGIDSTLETDELHQLIVAAITSLPDKCREVFVLSREQKLTNKEIADQLGISVKTVEAQITKALRNIKKQLGSGYAYLF